MNPIELLKEEWAALGADAEAVCSMRETTASIDTLLAWSHLLAGAAVVVIGVVVGLASVSSIRPRLACDEGTVARALRLAALAAALGSLSYSVAVRSTILESERAFAKVDKAVGDSDVAAGAADLIAREPELLETLVKLSPLSCMAEQEWGLSALPGGLLATTSTDWPRQHQTAATAVIDGRSDGWQRSTGKATLGDKAGALGIALLGMLYIASLVWMPLATLALAILWAWYGAGDNSES